MTKKDMTNGLRALAFALAASALLFGQSSCAIGGNTGAANTEQGADAAPLQEEARTEKPYWDQPAQPESTQPSNPERQDAPSAANPTNESELRAEPNQPEEIPSFSGEPYVALNGNVPEFPDSDFTASSFESYSEMDSLGRCGTAYACIGMDIMPTEERGEIGQIRPSGWHTVKYDIIDGIYLYNRCHLIGYQLAGENANEKNLITGTRYMNVEGMLPFEDMVADYVKETGNHVMYRVTPLFEGDNLLASGVQMEAESVEDAGSGISFNVFCYNVQPGIRIDYASGESELDATFGNDDVEDGEASENNQSTAYILNTNTHKFHYPTCSSVKDIRESNKEEFVGNREDVIAMGYEPCKRCNP